MRKDVRARIIRELVGCIVLWPVVSMVVAALTDIAFTTMLAYLPVFIVPWGIGAYIRAREASTESDDD